MDIRGTVRNSHLFEVSANLKVTRLMGAGQKIQAAVLNGCVIKCYPEHGCLMRVKRIVRIIHVEVGWICLRLLDHRVVVIQSHSLMSLPDLPRACPTGVRELTV